MTQAKYFAIVSHVSVNEGLVVVDRSDGIRMTINVRDVVDLYLCQIHQRKELEGRKGILSFGLYPVRKPEQKWLFNVACPDGCHYDPDWTGQCVDCGLDHEEIRDMDNWVETI